MGDGEERGSGEPDGVDRGEVGGEVLPGVALVLREPEGAGGRAEGEAVAGVVEVEGVAVDEVVGVLLGQAVAEHVEGAAAVAGAGDDQAAIHGDAALVLDAGDEPGRLGVFGMNGDSKYIRVKNQNVFFSFRRGSIKWAIFSCAAGVSDQCMPAFS